MIRPKVKLIVETERKINDGPKTDLPKPSSRQLRSRGQQRDIFANPPLTERNHIIASSLTDFSSHKRVGSPVDMNRMPTVSPIGSRLLHGASSGKKFNFDFKVSASSTTDAFFTDNLDQLKSKSNTLQLFSPFTRSNTIQLGSPLLEYAIGKNHNAVPQSANHNRGHSMRLQDRMPIVVRKRDETKSITVKQQTTKIMIDNLVNMCTDHLKKLTGDLSQPTNKEHAMSTSMEIELLSYRVIKILTEELNKKETALEEAFEKITKLEQETTSLNQRLARLSIYEENLEKMKEQLDAQFEQIQKNENLLQIERTKLEQEKSMLSTKFDSLSAHQVSAVHLMAESEAYKANAEQKIKKYEKIIDTLQTKLSKFDLKNNFLSARVEFLLKENENYLNKLEMYRDAGMITQKDLEQEREKANMYRERAFMQREDYCGLLEEYIDFQEDVDRMKEKITELQTSQKVLKDSISTEKKKPQDEMQREFLLMQLITDYYLKPSQKVHDESLPTRAYEMGTNVSMNISDFLVKKASFESLFEDLEIFIRRDIKPEFDLEFMATIRAIFDSKYNEFLLNPDDWRTFSRFPDFVHSWLGKFCVDNHSRQIRVLTFTDPEVEIIRRTFKENLNNKKVYKLWDAVAFREFLAETLAQDELVFYLHMRFLLFQGPQLKAAGGTFEYIHFVNFSRVEELFNFVLKDMFEVENIKIIIEKLKERVKIKNNRLLIDGAFCLRILLESYRKVKLTKFDTIRRLVESQPNISSVPEVYSISFRSFSAVLQAVCPNCSELEVTELYRLAWRIGKERVETISILTALNESGFLIKDLKLKAWIRLPNLTQDMKFDMSTPDSATCKFICDQYEALRETVDSANYIVGSLGVENILNQMFQVERFIQNRFQFNESALNGKDLVSLSLSFYSAVLRVNHVEIFLRSSMNKGHEIKYIENQFASMGKTLRELGEFKNEDILKELERSNWTRKLQRFLKNKLSSWYKLVSHLLHNKIKKLTLGESVEPNSPPKLTTNPSRSPKGRKKTTKNLNFKPKPAHPEGAAGRKFLKQTAV